MTIQANKMVIPVRKMSRPFDEMSIPPDQILIPLVDIEISRRLTAFSGVDSPFHARKPRHC